MPAAVETMMSVRETPWHKGGVVLRDAPRTWQEAAREAGADWKVHSMPIGLLGDGQSIDGHRAQVRDSDMRVLSITSDTYTTIQNASVFSFYDSVVADGRIAGGTRDWSALIPRDAIACIADLRGDVSIAIGAAQPGGPALAWFTTGAVSVCVKLSDDTFPAWEQVIPRVTPHTLTVERSTLLRAVNACAGGEDGGVHLTCTAPEGLHIGAYSKGDGVTARAQCRDARWDGPDGYKFGINARYLADMLAATDDETVKLRMSEPIDPVKLETADGTIAVCMPMRL